MFRSCSNCRMLFVGWYLFQQRKRYPPLTVTVFNWLQCSINYKSTQKGKHLDSLVKHRICCTFEIKMLTIYVGTITTPFSINYLIATVNNPFPSHNTKRNSELSDHMHESCLTTHHYSHPNKYLQFWTLHMQLALQIQEGILIKSCTVAYKLRMSEQ